MSLYNKEFYMNFQKPSPLLHGYLTNTPLDWIIKFLTPKQVAWLNTIIYRDQIFWINYWSLTHTIWGFIWGLMEIFTSSNMFNLKSLIIAHTLFEIWELWAGGYLWDRSFNFPEMIDCVMDTLFTIPGYYLAKLLFF